MPTRERTIDDIFGDRRAPRKLHVDLWEMALGIRTMTSTRLIDAFDVIIPSKIGSIREIALRIQHEDPMPRREKASICEVDRLDVHVFDFVPKSLLHQLDFVISGYFFALLFKTCLPWHDLIGTFVAIERCTRDKIP